MYRSQNLISKSAYYAKYLFLKYYFTAQRNNPHVYISIPGFSSYLYLNVINSITNVASSVGKL